MVAGFSPPAHEICLAEATRKIRRAMTSAWRVVAGSVAALVASAERTGWSFKSEHHLVDDEGRLFDFNLDPPIVIADAARRSVRR